MKRVLFCLFTISCAASLNQVQAQEKINMFELGVSVTIPSDWSEVHTSKLLDLLPSYGMYHIQSNVAGQYVAIFREECTSLQRKDEWLSGDVAKRTKRESDTLIPLPKESALTFGRHKGYESIIPRESIVVKSNSFYWAEDDWCYRADLGAIEEAFADATKPLQAIIDSITLNSAIKTSAPNLITVDLTSVEFSVEMDSTWKVSSDKTHEQDDDTVGMAYLVRVDTTMFDICLIMRFDSVDKGDKESWSKFNSDSNGYVMVTPGVELPDALPFDDIVANIYRQNRGDQDNEFHQSLYYVIRAIRGAYTYTITIGGLESSFEDKRLEYFAMLSSLRVADSD